ncbi:MAG: DUF3999 family protein [Ideonella sp.]|nr:DUF3999 family protein [Ideonella sp.]
MKVSAAAAFAAAGLAIVLLLTTRPVGAEAQDAPTAYLASVPLALEPAGQGLYRVPLPLALLARLRTADRHDVRVFNAAGESVPIAWSGVPPAAAAPEPRRIELPRFEWPPAARPDERDDDRVRVEVRSDGSVLRVERRSATRHPPAVDGAASDWLLDLSALAGELAVAIELQWNAQTQGIVRRAHLLASSDARVWRQVGDGTVLSLRDDASGQWVQQRRIALQSMRSDDRYLRLQFDAPLALQGAQAEMRRPEPALSLDSERFRLARAGPRTWTLDTGVALPVKRMQIHVPQDNSVLALAIDRRLPELSAGQAGDWVTAASHVAYRMVRDGAILNSPPLEVPGSAAREWRFTLDERLAPVELGLEATLWWPSIQLVFAERGPGPFQLALGRDNAPLATIERSQLIPGYREGDEFKLPLAELGVVVERQVAAQSFTDVWLGSEREQRRRWVLWGALAFAVLVLALLAWRLSRDLRTGQAQRPDS